MLRTLRCIPVFVLSLSLTAAAQDAPLTSTSKDVDIVVRLNEPDKTVESVVALVDAVQPGLGEMARAAVVENLGRAISNRTLTGVDMTRSWYMTVHSQGRAEPLVVFAIPAIETGDLVGALGDNVQSRVEGDWVFYTDKGDLPEAATGDDSVHAAMAEPIAKVLAQGELGIFVNADHLTQVYSEEIETGYEEVLEQLNNLRFAIPQNSGVNIGPVIEMYGTMVETFFQAVRDADAFSVAVSLDQKGIRIEELAEFKSGTDSAKFLENLPTSPIAELSKLPKGAAAYYGLNNGVKELTRWGVGLSAGMSDDEESREKIEAVIDQLDSVEMGSMAASVTIGDSANGMIQAAGIAHADPMDKFKTYMRESIVAMNDIEFPGVTQTSTIDEDGETFGDHKADVISIEQEYDPSQPGVEMQEQLQKVMFGPDGIQSRVVYLDDAYLTIMGGGKDGAEQFLKNYQAGRENGLAESRENLMEEVNAILFVDVASGVAGIMKAVSTVEGLPPMPFDAQMIDNLYLTQSYIGTALAAEGRSARCRTDLPVAQMQNIAKLVMLFAPLAAGQQF
ncbi:hypothetical protein AB1L42_05835 [Thalassoglobus sp. JC818]|uniref:hypothetical protein n=1 Tax=Thalassoglobus sp. JC818 TaxID=3232136 RepID=UPI00345A3FAE